LLPSVLPAYLSPDGTRGFGHKLRVLAWDAYYMQAVLPARARSGAVDLLHAPGFRFPLCLSVPVVVTIYDVIPLLFPQFFRQRDVMILSLYLRLVKRRARRVLTISEQSKRDISARLGVPEQQITVTYLGVSKTFRPIDQKRIRATLERFGVPSPYFLTTLALLTTARRQAAG
jgi:alpha-1,3-rhamnosyl/mannosyltransferase